MKTPTAIFSGILTGLFVTMMWTSIAHKYLRYFGPAKVTVINATGNTMEDVHVSLGRASATIGEMKDGRQATVPVRGEFSESSTHVHWRDSAGTNTASAGDYMEGCGLYHSTVVVTPDKNAKAIY